MRNLRNELDVDFIGGQKPLTREEESAISEYIRSQKQKCAKPKLRKVKTQRAKQAIRIS